MADGGPKNLTSVIFANNRRWHHLLASELLSGWLAKKT
jgi:hypothetical protein